MTMMILIAGPYRSGTQDNPDLIQANVDNMMEIALSVFLRGHLPVLGEWYALPLIEQAGSKDIGDDVFNTVFHPVARRLIPFCTACLRIGGESTGADDMVAVAQLHGKPVFYSIDEIPIKTI